MSWYVYIDGASSGPYQKDELKNFLKPADYVARVGSTAWIEAALDPDLADLFPPEPAIVDPVPEWYVIPKGKPQRGLFTTQALANMIRKNTVSPDDLVRHQSWETGVPIRETRAYGRITKDNADAGEIRIEEWSAATSTAAAPSTPAAASGKKAFRDRIRLTFEMTPAVWAILIVAALAPLVGYIGYQYFYRGSEMEFKMQYGTPAGECASDEKSKTICAHNASRCGCSEKGSCGMNCCVTYAKYNHLGKYR